MSIVALALSFVGGLVLWTLLEYCIHRWVFHKRWLGMGIAREHLDHHAKVDYFAPLAMKLKMAVPVLSVLALGGALVAAELGVGVTLGVFTGWLAYEVIHRRVHVAAPRSAYERWTRRHHLSHHFGKAHANHGVSSPLWDFVFRTYEVPGTIIVPKRHAAKFPWLVEEGERGPVVRDVFAREYRLA